MDSIEVIIARLVLGYLKIEKCRSAAKEFCKTSNNLQGTELSKSKYLPTRFVGLTLEDILSQYFEIYKIVQGRLEATNYYNEDHASNTLVEQLLYLLNKAYTSRASTPCPRSPLDSNLEASPSNIDPISDVETTRADTLPGNTRCVSEDSYLHKATRRKQPSKKYCKADSLQAADKDDVSEVLAQTLLENRGFHEKMAQSINKVAEKQLRVSSESNKTIGGVFRETQEADPIFDRILEEIIGSTTAINASRGSNSTCTSTCSNAKNTAENFNCRSKIEDKHSDSSESQDRSPEPDSKKVEEQNNEAIRSIVANSRLTSNTQVNTQEGQSNNEVILFEGTLDKYLNSNTCNANTQTQPIQNSVLVNTNGGLLSLVPPPMPINVVGSLQINAPKQYYVYNKPPTVGWNIPTLKTTTILTEQDILSMPTVIVNDDKHNKPAITRTCSQPPVITTLPTLVPKPTIEVPNEYFSNFNTGNSQQSDLGTVQTNTQSVIQNSNTDSPIKTDDLQTNTKSFPASLLVNNQSELRDEPSQTSEQNVPELPKDEPTVKTPQQPTPSQKATPKSGTHVRSLDFSTPPKITSTQKKSIKGQRSETPPFVHKKQAAKSLFKPHEEDGTEKSTKEVESKSDVIKKRKRPASEAWDADLRAIISTEDMNKDQTPKKKQKVTAESTKKIKKKGKKTANGAKQLNTTAQEAALLEAAIKTPIKNDTETPKVSADKEIEEGDVNKSIPSGSNDADTDAKSSVDVEAAEVRKSDTDENKQDLTEVGDVKTILSPSKLNASKRHIVSADSTPVDDGNKFITPETVKGNFHHPITRAKNITPLLETPVKTEVVPGAPLLPLTPMNPSIDPNLSLTSSVCTPFGKMLAANMIGDINALPTPSIPITPDFPLTPTIDLVSPYSNRPTDYSTSSSYYQPSDNEQNKSLEANLKELEKNPIKIHSDILIAKEEIVIISESEEMTTVKQNKSLQGATVREHLDIFNKSVIGKKNLNLMTRDSSSSSSSDKSSSESSSDESDSSSNSWKLESNKTVIHKKKSSETPKRCYSLRNRTTNVNNTVNTREKLTNTKSVKTPKTKTTRKRNVNSKQTSNTDAGQTAKPEKTVLNVTSKQTRNTNKDQSNTLEKSVQNVTSKQANDVNGDQTDKIEKTVRAVTSNNTNTNETEKLEKKEVERKETPNEGKGESIVVSIQRDVLKELEEKRLRTIEKFKSVEKDAPKKSTAKTPARSNNRFMKIKPIPNLTSSRRKPRKSDSPKKTVHQQLEKVDNRTPASKNDLSHDENKVANILLQLHNIREDNDKDLTRAPVDKSNPINMTRNVAKDEKSSDAEAQNLIEGLKERGIHLLHKKSSPTEEPVSEPQKENVNETVCSEIVDNSSKNDVSKTDALESKENSTCELESELRDTYDTCVFDGETEHVLFDECKTIIRNLSSLDRAPLTKTFLGKVYVEELDREIDVPLSFTPFVTLLEIFPNAEERVEERQTAGINKGSETVAPTETYNGKESKTIGKVPCIMNDVAAPTLSKEILKMEDDLMNYAVTGNMKDEPPEGSESPKSIKKRKVREEDNSHAEKKCKTLLKKINVDSFLNNIHGGT